MTGFTAAPLNTKAGLLFTTPARYQSIQLLSAETTATVRTVEIQKYNFLAVQPAVSLVRSKMKRPAYPALASFDGRDEAHSVWRISVCENCRGRSAL